jgi:hypothetical protein
VLASCYACGSFGGIVSTAVTSDFVKFQCTVAARAGFVGAVPVSIRCANYALASNLTQTLCPCAASTA